MKQVSESCGVPIAMLKKLRVSSTQTDPDVCMESVRTVTRRLGRQTMTLIQKSIVNKPATVLVSILIEHVRGGDVGVLLTKSIVRSVPVSTALTTVSGILPMIEFATAKRRLRFVTRGMYCDRGTFKFGDKKTLRSMLKFRAVAVLAR